MIWLNPIALLALAAVAAPILIHLFAHRRAPRVAFPTLRFVRPARMASVRRRALADGLLLLVRAAIVVLAAGAVAGPLVMTPARLRAWNATTIRTTVDGADLRGGLVRAVAWLDDQPPGRREIVVRSPFPLGALSAVDADAVPPNIGLRFERTSELTTSRTVPAGEVLTVDRHGVPIALRREVVLDTGWTSVRDVPANAPGRLAVEIVSDAAARAAADAAMQEALALRVPVPAAGRTARIVVADDPATVDAAPLRTPWMADAEARIRRDLPGDPASLRVGAAADTLLVATNIAPTDRAFVPLIHSVWESLAAATGASGEETISIPDAQLRAWTRDAGPAALPRPDAERSGTVRGDRRWVWGAVLILLAVEALMRRSSLTASSLAEAPMQEDRVA